MVVDLQPEKFLETLVPVQEEPRIVERGEQAELEVLLPPLKEVYEIRLQAPVTVEPERNVTHRQFSRSLSMLDRGPEGLKGG